MNYLAKYILIPIVITAATTFGIQNYVPLDWIDIFQPRTFGTTVTTIAGTDTISGSRTTINNNFTALNNGKVEVSTTTMGLLTGVGTITSGTWNSTAIGVGYGGTGTTSPSRYMIMLGNSSLGLTHASSTGTTGQFLTSNGTTAYPSWTTSSVDQTLTYYWTGRHAWNNTTSVFDATNMYIASTTGTLGIATTTSSLTNGTNIGNDVYISGGLGVGVATTTNNNIAVAGNILLGGTLQGIGFYASSTTMNAPTTGNNSVTNALSGCAAGYYIIGGGYQQTGGDNDPGKPIITASYMSDATTWTVIAFCNTGSTCDASTFTSYAYCAKMY